MIKAKWQFFIATLLLLSLTFCVGAAEQAVGAESQEKVVLKWIGNAGWEIQVGKTIILIDPFLTRKDRSMNAEWKTDEEAVLKVISGADYIFAGHSHHDHIGDVPFIAKRFGSKIVGSRTTANLALTAGVDKTQLVTIAGGEKLDFKDFTVEVIESRHAVLQRSRRTQPAPREEVTAPWAGPILGKNFVEGGSYLYYFSFGKQRVLNQSTANFLEGKLSGLQPDILLLATGHEGYDLKSALKTLKPKVVIVHHFDEWRAPFSQGLPASNRKRAERFQRDIKAADEQIKVIVPDPFMAYTLE